MLELKISVCSQKEGCIKVQIQHFYNQNLSLQHLATVAEKGANSVDDHRQIHFIFAFILYSTYFFSITYFFSMI